jgi:phage baseplate assembly protein V
MDVDTRNVFPRNRGRSHQLRDAFRHGKVIDRKLHEETKAPLVRVQFLDKQGLISYWLPIKQFGSRLTSHFYCPKIGDDVNVNFLANGVEHGFVDGSFFNKANPPPEGLDIDTRHFEAEDGTVTEYREIDSTFNMVCVGPVIVKGTTITVEGSESILEKAPTITLEGEQIVSIIAPEITLTGHMTFVGDITHTGNMTTSGVHTDANGIHGSMEREDVAALRKELDMVKERFAILERQVQMRMPLT